MDSDKAKQILSAYREDLADERDVDCREALDRLAEDPALAAWFEEERRFDREMTEALQAIPVPANLKARIVAAASGDRSPAATEAGAVADGPPGVRRSSGRTWWAAAAALAIIAISLFRYFAIPAPMAFPGTDFSSIDTFRNHMALYATRSFKLAHQTKDWAEARDWLRARQSPAYETVPGGLLRFEGLGCQTFLWGDHNVSLVCFRDENDEVVHLFIIDRDRLEDLEPATPLDEVLVQHRLETGGWMDEERVYLLVGSDPDVAIGELLGPVG